MDLESGEEMKISDRIVEQGYPDNCSIMYGNDEGEFVLHSEYKYKIEFAVEVLTNLKNCKVALTTPDQLNLIVDSAIEELRK